jgi:hypothetical protein
LLSRGFKINLCLLIFTNLIWEMLKIKQFQKHVCHSIDKPIDWWCILNDWLYTFLNDFFLNILSSKYLTNSIKQQIFISCPLVWLCRYDEPFFKLLNILNIHKDSFNNYWRFCLKNTDKTRLTFRCSSKTKTIKHVWRA